MKKLYHFLGGIHFAITLIGFTAVFVIAGTLIESKTESHQYAASLTYGHPAFITLLALYFINILFAATRRWPFQWRHIPFLTTHLGLLMILAGVMLKALFGVQGVMVLTEGSASNQLLLPNTRAIRLENKKNEVSFHPIGEKNALFQVIGYAPNSTEQTETWMKGRVGVISGLSAFPVFSWSLGDEIPVSGRAQFQPHPESPWEIIAIKSDSVEEAVNTIYQKGLNRGTARLNYCPINGFQRPVVNVDDVQIPLNGSGALLNAKGIDLHHTPTLALIQDPYEAIHLFFFDKFGRVHNQIFRSEKLERFAVYDEGFGGYAAYAEIPVYTQSREEKNQTITQLLETEISKADPKTLAPPLQLLYRACPDTFAECFLRFLSNRDSLPSLDWDQLESNEYKALRWSANYFSDVNSKKDLIRKGWPLPLPDLEGEELMASVIQQVFSIGDQLPDDSPLVSDETLFSTYLRAYGISLSSITPPLEQIAFNKKTITIECPITYKVRPAESLTKMEDNLPVVTLQFPSKERLTLPFDQLGTGLCRPTSDGQCLARFQSALKKIPYRVRLRNARQITYANSNQPFSYESDLIVSSGNKTKEVKISMNQVHETWDGYRFYLSSISPPHEEDVKRVQLIVNYDPAKYWLTYPGGVIVSLGILLLFWFWPKRS